METSPFGWFGKHPAHGDFVVRGVPAGLRDGLQDWLDGALGGWRQMAGPIWQQMFDEAPQMRFWIGAKVLGAGVSGLMVPSHDRVGRRYPLVLIWGGDPVPPPLGPEQAAYDALAEQLDAVRKDPALGQEVTPAQPVDDLLWARNGGGATQELLSDIAAEDMCRAAQTRSYWWVPGDGTREARVISVTGLPDGVALGWLWVDDAASETAAAGDASESAQPADDGGLQ